MAIKKQQPSGDKSRSYVRGSRRRPADGQGIAATFRAEDEKRQTQKTTMDFDKSVYRALKLHAVTVDTSIRDLVDGYVRAGLDADGVRIAEQEAGR